MSLILLFWSLELSLLCLKFLQYGNCGTDQPYAIISNVFSAINILLALLGLSPVHSDTICVNISLNHKLHSAWNASLLVNHHMRIKNRFSKKKLSYKFTNSNWINNQRDAKPNATLLFLWLSLKDQRVMILTYVGWFLFWNWIFGLWFDLPFTPTLIYFSLSPRCVINPFWGFFGWKCYSPKDKRWLNQLRWQTFKFLYQSSLRSEGSIFSRIVVTLVL